MGGGYEEEFIASSRRFITNFQEALPKMLSSAMAYAFFGQKWVPGVTELMNVIAMAAALLLVRRNPLWTLLILLTVAVTLVTISVPRYYVMVLPLMMLSWILLTCEIARRVPHRWLEVALVAGICAVVLPNFARCCKVIGEQRGWNRSADEGAKWKDVLDMGQKVGELVPKGEKVIAPGASIMSYVSGRECVMQRDILPTNKPPPHWPTHLAALNIHYAIFPSRLYKEGERTIRELMDRGVIVPTERVAKEGDLVLAKVEIKTPPEGKDWRKQPIVAQPFNAKVTAGGTTRPSAVQLAKKHHKTVVARHAAAKRQALARAKAEKLRRAQARAAARRAAAKARKKARATQPSTKPSAHLDKDVGGLSGQSSASRSASISLRVKMRDPALMPWQRFPADFHASSSARFPSQNGQVRHWSGRTG
jgi:hypothetical protein